MRDPAVGSVAALRKAAVVGVAQILLVCAVGAKLLYDRATLPRGWVATAGLDPDLPIRGRYVRLNAIFDLVPSSEAEPAEDGAVEFPAVALEVNPDTGMLQAVPTTARPRAAMLRPVVTPAGDAAWSLVEPLVFFLPDLAEDPSRLQADEVLWVEASVTRDNRLRPIRLGLYREGVLRPLPLD